MIHAIGQKNDGFAPLLMTHDFIGGQIDCVVQSSVAALTAPASASPATTTVTASSSTVARSRNFQAVQSLTQLLFRRSQILKQFRIEVEMSEKRLVQILAQNFVEKGVTGGFFLLKDIALAAAGIHKQAENQWQVCLTREVFDDLRLFVFREQEIVFRQVSDDLTGFRAHGRQNVDHFDVA